MRGLGQLGSVTQPDQNVHHHRLQDLADGIWELGEMIAKFERDESVDSAPELEGDGFGILLAAYAAAAHKSGACQDQMRVGSLEFLGSSGSRRSARFGAADNFRASRVRTSSRRGADCPERTCACANAIANKVVTGSSLGGSGEECPTQIPKPFVDDGLEQLGQSAKVVIHRRR